MKIVVFTGAGISRESGIATFRDSDGLWADNRIEDVCTPEALAKNRARVIEFYNTRRKEILSKEPNKAHIALAELEKFYDVEIITQNIDDLHERAGSTKVTHLHGEIRKLSSSVNVSATVPIDGWEQNLDTKHPDGSLLRPFVVFFGEGVPMMDRAVEIIKDADLLIITGTSLQVYPAAGLIYYLRKDVPIYIVDPNTPSNYLENNTINIINESAAAGIPKVVKELMDNVK